MYNKILSIYKYKDRELLVFFDFDLENLIKAYSMTISLSLIDIHLQKKIIFLVSRYGL